MKNNKVLFILAVGALTAPLLAANGTKASRVEAASNTYLEKTFTTDGIADAKASSNITVQAAGGEFAGIKPVNGGAVSYLTYEISTIDASSSFESMTLTIDTGRFAYYFGDYGVNFDVYVSDSETLPTEKAYTVAATGSALTSISATLDEKVASLAVSTLYVSFGFSPKTIDCGYDVSWTIFDHVTIAGTEKASAPSDIIKHKVGDNWRNGTSNPNSKIYNANNVYNIGGDGNATHGAIVGTWGGSLSVSAGDHGWVEYKLGADDEILQSASFTFVAKFNNMGNGDIHSGDRLLVKVSSTGEDADYENHIIAKYCHFDEEGWINAGNSDEYTQMLDLTDFISSLGKTKHIYVRFEMLHYVALSNVELNLWGTKMFETSASYESKKGYFIDYNLDGGILPTDSESAFYATDAVYTLPTPNKADYVFKGWEDSEGNKVTSFDPSAKADLSVKAVWELENNAHTITYINAEGAVNDNPTSYKDLDSVITLTDLSKEGYDFLGFYDASEGGTKVTTIDPSTDPGDIVLYARWAEKEFAIAHDVDEGVSLAASGLATLPEKIKYTETITFKATANEGCGIAQLLVDDKLVDPAQDIVLKGSDLKAHSIQAVSFAKYNVSSKVDEDYASMDAYDFAFGERAYDFSNIAIKRDGAPGAGLSKAKEGEDAYVAYKFVASEGKKITKVKLTGLARIFDYYGRDAKMVAYTSTDNADWKALKEYSPNNLTDGEETVSLDYSKTLEGEDALYVKIAWDCESGGNDWVVLKKLGIEISETAVTPSSSEEPSSSEVPSSSDSGSISNSSDSKTDGDISKKDDNVGTIVAASVGISVVAAAAIAGVVTVFVKRKKSKK